MAGISFYNSSSISTLFSGLNGSSTGFSSGLYGINLADYASIRSGSYSKLMKSYYAEVAGTDSKTKANAVIKKNTPTTTAVSKETTETLARTEKKAEDLKDAADTLLTKGSKSVFKKEEKTDADGNTTYAYNTDKIYQSVKAFTEKYNSMLDEAKKSSVSRISNAATSMQRMTKANSALLSKMGITIKDDATLEIDEEAFKKADMNQVKSTFNTSGSYGYQISAQASMIDYYAQNEASKANTYNRNGMFTYNYNTGDIYSSYM